jgi:hypothetical protein
MGTLCSASKSLILRPSWTSPMPMWCRRLSWLWLWFDELDKL